MPATDEQQITQIAEEIRSYLQAHPHAADSVEGIASWWLSGSDYDAAIEHVRLALDRLVRQGVAAATVSPDGHVLYAAGRHGRKP